MRFRTAANDGLVFQKHKVRTERRDELRVRSRPLPRAARRGARPAATGSRSSRASREDGDVILRHDVDLSLDAALRMAELEADAGAAATYFLMTGSVFYNLALAGGRARARAAARARPPRRPARRLSAPRPRRPLRPGHRLAQPRPGVHARAGRGRDQRDGDAVVRSRDATAPTRTSTGARAARTRSCATARSRGCSCSTHPEIWVYPGTRMGETMRAMLEEEKERRLEQLAADRIDLS